MNSPADSVYRVQVLDRAAGILQILADARTDLGPADIAARLSLHKSTIHRLLAALELHGYIRKQQGTGKYSLGLKLFELGSRAVARLDLHDCAQPLAENLVEQTGETVHVCVADDGQMVSVVIAESPRTVRTPATVGRRTPMHCTAVGKSWLAWVPADALEALLERHPPRAYTPNTIVARPALMDELRRIRACGYAVDEEEIELGLRCVGAPVRNHSGNVVAAISVAGPAFRISRKSIPVLARAVMATASRLSDALGYRPSPVNGRAGWLPAATHVDR
ncbi:MAG: IclR family transcriptional regulator [Vicinamibacterales bacterium]